MITSNYKLNVLIIPFQLTIILINLRLLTGIMK